MKKYNIVVNGTSYTVEVEELGGAPAAPAAAAAPAPAPAAPAAAPAPVAAAPAPAPAPEPAAAAAPSAGGMIATSPMPGTIMEIKVSVGQSVKEGDTLVILEAMKMENEIPAPRAGVVDAILTSKDASVNAGDPLVSLK